ncbi:MAG TPA: hypothetical protein PKE27_21685 [Povalibacter sp.]|uniref:NUDIX hydrolase n=1 Tax=Povalibacter sp. TaxID=1962978 RepID=UPI002B882F3F|nr:hypothetical protein [Povalibacter sp.]HMN47205.1 hypothetical protein [Povalibacter sp.]
MTTPAGDPNTSASLPRLAATILLLREAGAQVEVLMVRRHANLSFMAGMWVFPGGSLHPSDSSAAALELLDVDAVTRRISMVDLHGDALDAEHVCGLVFAACRETFEETGVLLAKHDDGSSPSAALLERVQPLRATSNENAEVFVQLLRDNELRPDLAGMTYWAHWITPSSAPKRFDTRFFIVRAPQAHLASADTGETVESVWMTPHDLLQAAQRRDMPISHPTQCNLHDLQATLTRYGSLDALLAGEATRKVMPILPKMFRAESRMAVVMPWDADYESSPGDGLPVADCGALQELPSRVLVDR